jgi:predicted kinase
MEQTLIVIRGVPGSGKTTKAKQIIAELSDHQVSHYEADHYFTNDRDGYVFDATKLRQAHDWCRRQTRVALDDGDIVIVSNTFTQNWELQEYIDMALAKSIPVQIIECDGDWQNVHGVPDSKVQAMRDRFESNHKLQAIWQSHEKQHLITFE